MSQIRQQRGVSTLNGFLNKHSKQEGGGGLNGFLNNIKKVHNCCSQASLGEELKKSFLGNFPCFFQIEIFLLLWLTFGSKAASITFSTPVEQRQSLPEIIMMTVVVMLMMI